MSTPEQIRVLRYHMTSGHVLQETVDRELADVSDSELLQRISGVFLERRYITITEGTVDSGVLISTDRIEFVQVAHAELLISREDMEAAVHNEETAIETARKLWGLGHGGWKVSDDDTA